MLVFMRVEIRKQQGKFENVIIITFHTKPEEFDSEYERSKFFRSLHGWQQSVSKNEKRYTYRRPGLLDEMQHVKIADSVFMTALQNLDRIESFFDEWRKKVEVDIMEVMMQKSELEKMFRQGFEH